MNIKATHLKVGETIRFNLLDFQGHQLIENQYHFKARTLSAMPMYGLKQYEAFTFVISKRLMNSTWKRFVKYNLQGEFEFFKWDSNYVYDIDITFSRINNTKFRIISFNILKSKRNSDL